MLSLLFSVGLTLKFSKAFSKYTLSEQIYIYIYFNSVHNGLDYAVVDILGWIWNTSILCELA